MFIKFVKIFISSSSRFKYVTYFPKAANREFSQKVSDLFFHVYSSSPFSSLCKDILSWCNLSTSVENLLQQLCPFLVRTSDECPADKLGPKGSRRQPKSLSSGYTDQFRKVQIELHSPGCQGVMPRPAES